MLQYLVKPDPIQRVAYDRFGVLQLNLSRARNAGKSPDTRIRQPLHMLTRYLSHFATFSAVSRLRRKTERADAFCSVEAPFPSSRNTSQSRTQKTYASSSSREVLLHLDRGLDGGTRSTEAEGEMGNSSLRSPSQSTVSITVFGRYRVRARRYSADLCSNCEQGSSWLPKFQRSRCGSKH